MTALLLAAVLLADAAGAPAVESAYAAAAEAMSEAAHRDRIADHWRANGIEVQEEATAPAGTRCDLLTATHAYEIDFAHKFYECTGQAVYYASVWHRKPGMVLLVKPGDERFVQRAKMNAAYIKAEIVLVPVDGDVPLPSDVRPKPQVRSPMAQKVEGYYFGAEWCGPCRIGKPHVLALKSSGYDITILDTDKNQQLAADLQVNAIPQYLILTDGKVTSRHAGPLSKADAETFFAPLAPRPRAPSGEGADDGGS
jgi:thiol-disulfide isomerase/thioredoxin